eukprot:COSAG03_NODE_16369_length_404_cov_0.508197_1_plen_35_part_10
MLNQAPFQIPHRHQVIIVYVHDFTPSLAPPEAIQL